MFNKITLVSILALGMFAAAGAFAEEAPAPAKKAESVKVKKAVAKEPSEAKAGKKETRPNGLVIEDVKVGKGIAAELGKKITVKYRGTFGEGKEFDSSGDKEISFELREGSLIKGWTQGIPGMKVGGKRKLHVPSDLAYGKRGTPDNTILPDTDLNFEVELMKVE